MWLFFRHSSCYLSRGQFITHCFVHAIKSFNWAAIHLCHENVPCDVEAIILLGQCSTLQSKRKRCVKFCKASHKAHWPFLKEAVSFFQDAVIPKTSVFSLKCSLQWLLGISLHFIYNRAMQMLHSSIILYKLLIGTNIHRRRFKEPLHEKDKFKQAMFSSTFHPLGNCINLAWHKFHIHINTPYNQNWC